MSLAEISGRSANTILISRSLHSTSRKTDIGDIVSVLSSWCDNCDSMLTNIESQVEKVNKERGEHLQHKAALETKIK